MLIHVGAVKSPIWSTDSRPGSPSDGQYGFNVTLGYEEVWDGSNWVKKNDYDSDYVNVTGDTMTGALTVPAYERHVQLAATLTGNAANQPSPNDIQSAGGLVFSSATDQSCFVQWEIPDDWAGDDVYFEVDWAPYSAAMSGTSTVKWDVDYRAIAEGETLTNGTLAQVSSTDDSDYSQYQTKHARVTLPYDDANQPLTKQDHMYFEVRRDTGVANDFTGTVIVTAFEVIYNSVTFPTSN